MTMHRRAFLLALPAVLTLGGCLRPDFRTADLDATGTGSIGSLAVNVRAAPSKTGAKIGVLNAGSTVRIGENVDGWIHVFFSGGDGWVYQTYLAGG